MGVAWVLEVKESVRSVELAFEQAGGILDGTSKSFKVDCTWYRPVVTNQISSFYVLHHSDYPESSFIIGTGEHEGSIRQSRGTADRGFDLILGKLNAGLTPDLATRFEVTGSEYHLKDFRLRVGTLSIGTTVKGTIVEVEYAASNIVFQCHSMLQEAVETFFPGYASNSNLKPEILTQTTHPDNYYPIDTMAQYLEVFLGLRKRA